jgi:hypothetical protein
VAFRRVDLCALSRRLWQPSNVGILDIDALLGCISDFSFYGRELWQTHRSNPLSEIHQQAIPCFGSIGSESRFTNVILPKAIYRRA